MTDNAHPTAAQLATALRTGQTTAVTLAEDALARAEASRDEVGAFVALTEEIALAAAAQADRELAGGVDRGVLHGVPVAVKDVIDVRGVPTENGTTGLGWRVPTRDAAAWSVLRTAGAVLVGKTRTHELAWGATTPGCRNPTDLARSAGGSSGGSAAAVAAGTVCVALGTDTGGSIRLPASLCGVVGFRPPSGAVNMAGITPLAPTQDVVGALGASVADCASVAHLLTPSENFGAGQTPARVGVIEDRWAQRMAPDVADVFGAVHATIAETGMEPVSISVPLAELAPAASYVTMLAESAELWWEAARLQPGTVGPSVRALLRVGATVKQADHARARVVSRAIRDSVSAAMEQAGADLLALPTVPVTAQPHDTALVALGTRRVPIEAAYVSFTALASVAGLAALSIPCGAGRDGLPIGLQLIAGPGRDGAMWSVARRLERPVGGLRTNVRPDS